MNIFKILANGYGSVNENHVSAFFAYLIDPNENHSLDLEFTKRFVELILPDIDFNVNNYDCQVFLEQKIGTERVDIVIVFYKTFVGSKSQSKLKQFIENKKEVERIILVENKIRTNKNPNQVLRQRASALDQFNLEESNIHSVYLTPDKPIFKQEFIAVKDAYTTHCLWHNEDDKIVTITDILKDIIKDETEGVIEPIAQYTKQTLKAFIQFVASDFKSEKKLKQDKKARDLHYTFDSFYKKYPSHLNSVDFEIVKSFVADLDKVKLEDAQISYRFSPTHPVSVFYRKKKIFGIHRRGRKIYYDIIFSNYPELFNLYDENLEKEYEVVSFYNNNPKIGVRVKPKTNSSEEIILLFQFVYEKLKISFK